MMLARKDEITQMKTIQDVVIRKAIDVAKSSDVVRGKVGAVLFTDRGRILTFSSNSKYMSNEKKRFTIHAEEYVLAKAIRQKIFARFADENINLLVVRWRKKDNKLSIAKPCKHCQEIIRETQISTFYSNKNGKIEQLNIN
jgi:cytidine deaminase